MKSSRIALYLAVLICRNGMAGTLTEDFTSFDHADLQNSTGIWNISDPSIRPRAYADGTNTSTRPIDFGDGSDGEVSSTTGYTFDTDSHPNGYNFRSLSITGGVITVTGSNPLIIRSLSTITITPDLKVNGGNGTIGSALGGAIAGGVAKTCLATGGAGGAASVNPGNNGGDGIQSDGTTEAATHGTGQGVVNTAAVDGQGSITGPASNDFETAANFICGTSGPGGGGYWSDAGTFASGGSGGAGGGILKLVSVGNLSLGITEAKGGNGGDGFSIAGAAPGCSGNGSGGNGGVIFVQTLGTLTTGTDPDVSGGNSGSACFGGSGGALGGFTRGDTNSTTVRPAWATAAGSYDSDLVPASLSSSVQSKAYDLGTLNAGFSTPTITSVLNGGTISMSYAGSANGVTYSDFTTSLDALSNQGYRYLKFKATFTNAGVAGAAPKITQVSIPYSELGLAALDVKLSAGCGTIQRVGNSNPKSDQAGAILFGFWLALWICAKAAFKSLRRPHRASR